MSEKIGLPHVVVIRHHDIVELTNIIDRLNHELAFELWDYERGFQMNETNFYFANQDDALLFKLTTGV